MATKRLLAAGLVVMGAGLATAEPFKDGDRVALFGDSVTHWGFYTSQIESFYYTRYPDRDIRIWNCGVGGDTLEAGMWRLEADVLGKKPTAVSVLFGMNDVGVDAYRTNATPHHLQCRDRACGDFEKNLAAMKEMFDRGGYRGAYLWCTPVPWDDELKFKPPREPIRGVTAAEAGFAKAVRDFRDANGGTLVELYDPMLAYNRKLHEKDPYASLSPDTIHPQQPGGLFIAACFLKAQGADGTVSDVTVDAANGIVASAANACVTDVKKAADGTLSFVSQEKALPFPVERRARALADDIGFDDALNRERLAVTGLAGGDWALKVDGVAVVTNTAAGWAKGVNLAAFETPMMRQARAAAVLNAERSDKEVKLRSLWCARKIMVNRIFCMVPRSTYPSMADFDDPKVWKAFCVGFLKGNRDREHSDFTWLKDFFEKWDRRPEFEAEIDALHGKIRAACRPQPHRFEIAPVK